MILPIDDHYRIAGDRYGWAIECKRTRKGKATWEACLWFTFLESAINELANLMVRTSDAQTLAETLAEVKKVSTKLLQALTPRFEVRAHQPEAGQAQNETKEEQC